MRALRKKTVAAQLQKSWKRQRFEPIRSLGKIVKPRLSYSRDIYRARALQLTFTAVSHCLTLVKDITTNLCLVCVIMKIEVVPLVPVNERVVKDFIFSLTQAEEFSYSTNNAATLPASTNFNQSILVANDVARILATPAINTSPVETNQFEEG